VKINKKALDLKFGHCHFLWLPLTSATLEVGWKTSNFIVDFDVEKKGRFWSTLKVKVSTLTI
jgi:hypothetical protein